MFNKEMLTESERLEELHAELANYKYSQCHYNTILKLLELEIKIVDDQRQPGQESFSYQTSLTVLCGQAWKYREAKNYENKSMMSKTYRAFVSAFINAVQMESAFRSSTPWKQVG